MLAISQAAELGGCLGKALDLSSSHAYSVLVGDEGYLLRFTVGSSDATVSLRTSDIRTDAIVAIRKVDAGAGRLIVKQGSTVVSWLSESQITVVLRWNGTSWVDFEPPRSDPPVFSGRVYRPAQVQINTGTLVATLDTVMYLCPFFMERDFAASKGGIRIVNNAAAGGKVKLAFWANAPTTFGPIGNSIYGDNTEYTTTTASQTREYTGNYTFLRGNIYWLGAAFSTQAPQPSSINSGGLLIDKAFGRAASANGGGCGFTTPFTYANNITTTDLTGAVLTELTSAAGCPVPQLTAA